MRQLAFYLCVFFVWVSPARAAEKIFKEAYSHLNGNDGKFTVAVPPITNLGPLEITEEQVDSKGRAVRVVSHWGNYKDTFLQYICRNLKDGSPDFAFGTQGVILVPGVAKIAQLDNQEKVLLVSISDQEIGLWKISRFDSDGKPDLGFGKQGNTAVTFEKGIDPYQLIRREDGRFLIAGLRSRGENFTTSASSNIIALAGLLPDGSPDLSFGESGKVSFEANGKTFGIDLFFIDDNLVFTSGSSNGPLVAAIGFVGFVGQHYETYVALITITATGKLETVLVQDVHAGSSVTGDQLTFESDLVLRVDYSDVSFGRRTVRYQRIVGRDNVP